MYKQHINCRMTPEEGKSISNKDRNAHLGDVARREAGRPPAALTRIDKPWGSTCSGGLTSALRRDGDAATNPFTRGE